MKSRHRESTQRQIMRKIKTDAEKKTLREWQRERER